METETEAGNRESKKKESDRETETLQRKIFIFMLCILMN